MGVAHADVLHEADLVAAPAEHSVEVGVDDATKYWLSPTNANIDGQQGCNATDGSPANVSINVPVHVTAVPSSLSFSQCGVDNFKTVNFSADAPGDYFITATVNDRGSASPDAYNETPATFTLHVTAPGVEPEPEDTTAPVITVSNIEVEATGPTTPVTFNATAFDAGDNAAVPVTFDDSGPFTVGVHTVVASARDSHNNTATKSFTVTVTDKTPPALKLPSDVSVYGWNGFFQPIDNGDVDPSEVQPDGQRSGELVSPDRVRPGRRRRRGLV